MPLWTGIGRPDPTWWSQIRFEPDPTRSSQTRSTPSQLVFSTLPSAVTTLPRRHSPSPPSPPSRPHRHSPSPPAAATLAAPLAATPDSTLAVVAAVPLHGCVKMASPVQQKRLRPSIDSPSKGVNLSWVPDGYALSPLPPMVCCSCLAMKSRTI